MLTGGNTAKQLYLYWTDANHWNHSKIKYYFGDERSVPPDHQESNYGMVRRTLFPNGIPKECKVIRIEGELSDREEATIIYEKKFRKQ
jgi:6-phosphogluconolactonase